MKVYLIKNVKTNQYYLKKHRWSDTIFCESFFTKRAAKWHSTYVVNNSWKYEWVDGKKEKIFTLQKDDVVVEEYEMVKVGNWLQLKDGQIALLNYKT